ncbi:hypothetical protein BDR07DRAFT_1418586 [Suillus spraguei]|nr:hypothetical protein BDR07DRAFT_1418586 [Suillus spraguei]
MDACDSVELDGTNKLSTDERGSYSYAQKMRAAVTYAFGRLQGLGNLLWHESELHSGQMLGNPSVSVEVSSYMCSLWHCKVQAGKVAISAHAITSHILKRMYHFNHHPENCAILDYRPGGCGDGLLWWAGGCIRRCLHAAYTIAFLCMLRCDEVLKIQLHDLLLRPYSKGERSEGLWPQFMHCPFPE